MRCRLALAALTLLVAPAARAAPGGPPTASPDLQVDVHPADPLGRRVALETGFGLLGTAVGFAAGAALVLVPAGMAGDTVCSHGSCSPALPMAGVAGAVGGLLGLGAGVTLGGHLVEGRGRYGPSVLGALAGGAASLPLWGLAAWADAERGGAADGLFVASAMATGVLAVGGSVLFYEAFSSPRPKAGAAEPTPRWIPTIAVSGRGDPLVGLSLRF